MDPNHPYQGDNLGRDNPGASGTGCLVYAIGGIALACLIAFFETFVNPFLTAMIGH